MPVPHSSLTKLCESCGYRLESALSHCPVDGSPLAERPAASFLGTYRLVERLGTGGMGVVYRAVHEKLGRTVAIKVLHRSSLADRTNVARFFQEARMVNTIRHPNVVDIYDFVTADKDIYTVMEFLVGQDLHQAIYEDGGRPLPLIRAVNILEQVAGALAAAHDRNIIHRDLKPANVFLSRRGALQDFTKVLDFGLAKLQRSEGRMTQEGQVLGTPEYMAPEQARGQPLDTRADIYALGCLAYHTLTGCQLFGGGSYAEAMVRHVKETPPPLCALNPDLPPAVQRVVLRALSKDPGERQPSAQVFAMELAAATARPFDLSGAFSADISSARPAEKTTPESAPAPRSGLRWFSHRWRHTVTFAGVAALGAIAVVALRLSATAPNGAAATAASSSSIATHATLSTGPAVERLAAVRLQSHPAGAVILDEHGRRIGTTPHDLVVGIGQERKVKFVVSGHWPVERTFRAHADTTVVVVLTPHRTRTAPETASGRRHRLANPLPVSGPPDKSEVGRQTYDQRANTLNPFAQ